MYPETQKPLTQGKVRLTVKQSAVNVLDALAQGTISGGKLAFNIALMLISFLSVVALLNAIMGGIGYLIGFPQLSLDLIFSYLFSPISFLMVINFFVF